MARSRRSRSRSPTAWPCGWRCCICYTEKRMPGASVLVVGGRVLDPGRGVDRIGDLRLDDGRVTGIVGIDCQAPARVNATLEARGRIVAPGFVDIHSHLRTPGQEHKETIASGTRSAAK